jgi:hypothetical protein
MRLIWEIRPFGPHPVFGLGVDELRWLAPVRPGDVLHLEGEVVKLTPSKTRPQGVMRIKWTAFNQRGRPTDSNQTAANYLNRHGIALTTTTVSAPPRIRWPPSAHRWSAVNPTLGFERSGCVDWSAPRGRGRTSRRRADQNCSRSAVCSVDYARVNGTNLLVSALSFVQSSFRWRERINIHDGPEQDRPSRSTDVRAASMYQGL